MWLTAGVVNGMEVVLLVRLGRLWRQHTLLMEHHSMLRNITSAIVSDASTINAILNAHPRDVPKHANTRSLCLLRLPLPLVLMAVLLHLNRVALLRPNTEPIHNNRGVTSIAHHVGVSRHMLLSAITAAATIAAIATAVTVGG